MRAEKHELQALTLQGVGWGTGPAGLQEGCGGGLEVEGQHLHCHGPCLASEACGERIRKAIQRTVRGKSQNEVTQ